MKLIQQSADLWKQPEGEIGIYKQIERAARLCYMSADKITDDSYKKFITMLKCNGHNSPFEAGTVYLAVPFNIPDDLRVNSYANNLYSIVRVPDTCKVAYITTNYRVLLENDWLDDMKFLCEPTEYHEKRISVHMVTSIGVSREANRHKHICAA